MAEREGKLERKAGGTSKIPEKSKEGSYVTRKESKSGKEKKQRHSEAKAEKKEAALRTKIQNVANVACCFRARIKERKFEEDGVRYRGKLRRRIIEREVKITRNFEKYKRERKRELMKLPREEVSFMNFIKTCILREIEDERRK